MKTLVTAYIAAISVVILVFVNSFILSYNIDALITKVENAPDSVDAGNTYTELYDDYKRREKYIALTISHSDLLGIEDSFAEMTGAIKAKDEESLIIAKSRLIEALTHIKRLAGINFDSVF